MVPVRRFCYLPKALHDAFEADDAALRSDEKRSRADPTLSVHRYFALEALDAAGKQFEDGDKSVVLPSIRRCAQHDLALPTWLSAAYIAAYDEVLNCRVGSWDEAFGRPFPKGTNLAARRKKRNLMFGVYKEVNAKHAAGAAIDTAMFEEVGKLHNIGKSLCAEYYYEAKKWGFREL